MKHAPGEHKLNLKTKYSITHQGQVSREQGDLVEIYKENILHIFKFKNEISF